MKSKIALLPLGISLITLAVTALDHFHGHSAYLMHLNTTQSLLPLSKVEHVEATQPPLARRVTVLFLDGLGYETALRLPNLQKLSKQGTLRPIEVEFPSYTYPGVVAYSTGLPPLYTGLRLNHSEHLHHLSVCFAAPSLVREAQRSGLSVRFSSGDWPDFHSLLDFEQKAPELPLEQILKPSEERALNWIYFGEIDHAGHLHGGESAQYKASAIEGDKLLARVIAATDLSKDAVVVISDHGHLPQGGHGGVEPTVTEAMFFAIGAGVKATQAKERALYSYLDVAPSVAALLGISSPAAGLGRPMLDAFTLSPEAAAKRLALDMQQRLTVEELLTPGARTPEAMALLARLQQGDASSLEPSERLLDRLVEQRREAYEATLTEQGSARLWWAVAVAGLLLLGVGWLHKSGRLALRWADLVPTILYTTIYVASYYFAGYRISWSLPRGEAGFLLETLLYGALAVTISFWVSRRRNQWHRLAQETLVMTLFFGLPYLLFSAWVGLDPKYLYGPSASFWVIFLATIGFYGHGPYGIALFVQSLRHKTTPAPR